MVMGSQAKLFAKSIIILEYFAVIVVHFSAHRSDFELKLFQIDRIGNELAEQHARHQIIGNLNNTCAFDFGMFKHTNAGRQSLFLIMFHLSNLCLFLTFSRQIRASTI